MCGSGVRMFPVLQGGVCALDRVLLRIYLVFALLQYSWLASADLIVYDISVLRGGGVRCSFYSLEVRGHVRCPNCGGLGRQA